MLGSFEERTETHCRTFEDDTDLLILINHLTKILQ